MNLRSGLNVVPYFGWQVGTNLYVIFYIKYYV
ncbi:hypothetical protein R83H12_01374 [Fibrobacteria bacterium R8-3-H12]